jgi:dolichyl-diphosphooligosaccharide--protein glycosyltransferase
MNAYVCVEYIKANLPEKQFAGLLRVALSFAIILFVFVFVYLTISGNTKWSGRSMSLLDPTYAKKYIPIVASVSEHQPTAWANYFFDLGYVLFFMPAGYYFCLKEDVTHGKIFLALFGVLSTYFSCVMIRLMLTLAPIACIISGIAVSEIFTRIGESTRQHLKEYSLEDKEKDKEPEEPKKDDKKSKGKQTGLDKIRAESASKGSFEEENRKKRILPFDIAVAMGCFIMLVLNQQVYHSTLLAGEAYSSPTIVMATRG